METESRCVLFVSDKVVVPLNEYKWLWDECIQHIICCLIATSAVYSFNTATALAVINYVTLQSRNLCNGAHAFVGLQCLFFHRPLWVKYQNWLASWDNDNWNFDCSWFVRKCFPRHIGKFDEIDGFRAQRYLAVPFRRILLPLAIMMPDFHPFWTAWLSSILLLLFLGSCYCYSNEQEHWTNCVVFM